MFLAAGLSAALAPAAPVAVAAKDTVTAPRKLVHAGIDDVLSILKRRGLPRRQKLELLRRTFKRYFDHRTIARYAAGRHFRTASAAERRRYVRALEEYLVYAIGAMMLSFAQKIDLRLRSRDIFRIVGDSRPRPNYIIVHSRIKRRAARFLTFDWVLRRRGEGWKAVDLVVLGISQLNTFRSQFQAVIRQEKSGLAGLTRRLEAKVRVLKRGGRVRLPGAAGRTDRGR